MSDVNQAVDESAKNNNGGGDRRPMISQIFAGKEQAEKKKALEEAKVLFAERDKAKAVLVGIEAKIIEVLGPFDGPELVAKTLKESR
jgi:hypothetical protein